ncbi:MAG TPA: DotU family type IV/VI secretion system protein [Acidobacteriaceae bacterium]|nr:DotU family type IV/VI secretion system protein [Acidobacteriaceae bacterium]
MNESPPRTQNLASCYENSITTILRLGAQQQALQNAQVFRGNIRAALKAAMEQARALGYSSEMIQLSFAAVVSFLDESVLILQSPTFADWSQRTLQEELFGHNRMGEVFFENLRGLLSRPETQEGVDCLEVYLLCLLLGYRGRYAFGGGGDIEMFIRQMREKIARFRGPMLFLRPGPTPPVIKRASSIDRWSRGLGIAALCLLLVMLLAFGGFWFALSSGISQLG